VLLQRRPCMITVALGRSDSSVLAAWQLLPQPSTPSRQPVPVLSFMSWGHIGIMIMPIWHCVCPCAAQAGSCVTWPMHCWPSPG
jgi:hypothetical protein